MTCGVYAIVCVATGHRYVGSSKHVEQRWQTHRSNSSNPRLAAAIQEHGTESFNFEVLEEVDDDDRALDVAERRWIAHYADVDRASLYNVHLDRPRSPRRPPTVPSSPVVAAPPPAPPETSGLVARWITRACHQSDAAQARGDEAEAMRWLAYAQQMIDDMPGRKAQIRRALAPPTGTMPRQHADELVEAAERGSVE